MQAATSNLRIVSNEPEQGIVALDEASLDDVNGGLIPLAVVGAAAGGFALGVGAAIGVAYLVREIF
jgi:lactobin A/cerein 7B family class IIb bacteriocin